MADLLEKDTGARIALAIRVRGQVQGVGFRPTVWRLARECRLAGDVLNDGEGVLIRAWGERDALRRFTRRLRTDAPPLARIDSIDEQPLKDEPARQGFKILRSGVGQVRTGVVPDAATCPDCLAEAMDPGNRRYRYPFTNCTHCGPRLSIIKAIPYDRAQTSMAVFPLCPTCGREYADPGDRRFHAQPNACGECGPRLWLEDGDGREVDILAQGDAAAAAARLIAKGAIVAIKGLGGFHLACDATNEKTVAELRRRKRRYDKPFALMAGDIATVRDFAHVGGVEEELLNSVAAPIVVLEARGEGKCVAPAVAPAQTNLGFMLPYTPLHHLLMRELDRPIVLTSGNRSDEPQCIANEDARERLTEIADAWLMHDRDIVNRLDDSVVRVMAGAPRLLRRARGYAPAPVRLPSGFEKAPPVLAMGGELKVTFCLLKDREAILSQHMGDLEDASVHTDYRENLSLYRQLYEFDPEIVAVDGHPDYLSTQWGATVARAEGARLESVQHHHAHVAACMAEHSLALDHGPVLGIVLDGLGYGDDGRIWGGEFLRADYRDFERLAHFAPAPLIGGARAMREPWRNTYAFLATCIGWENVTRKYPGLPLIDYLEAKPLAALDQMMARGLNAPLAVSAGRLFDAAAGALGICREGIGYEGQAAIELEALAGRACDERHAYGFDIDEGALATIGWAPLWQGILADLNAGVDPAIIAARFHNGVADASVAMAVRLAATHGIYRIILSGGVFQNRLLLERVSAKLRTEDFDVLIASKAPANDGGLALGQAVVAAARTLDRT